jgi:membrane-associated phospholipid phosphatase
MTRWEIFWCSLGVALGLWLWWSGWDAVITHWLAAHDEQSWNTFWRWVGVLGLGRFQVGLSLLLALWYGRVTLKNAVVYRQWPGRDAVRRLPLQARVWLAAVPVVLGAGLVGLLVKVSVGRPRPKMMLWHDIYWDWGWQFQAKFWSFPSGHTVTTFALLALLHHAFPRWRWVWWPVAIVVGMARFLAVTPHYMGDVVAGMAIGYGVGVMLTRRFKLHVPS